MANWQGAILTNKGRALQAKVEGGLCQLALTKLKTGDGTLAPGQTLEALTDLVSPKQNIAISAVVVDENQPGVVYVKGILSNASLTTGYLVKELGLFATDPDDGEILYAVTVDSNPDYLQGNTSATVITEALKLAIAVSNTSDVTATLDPEGLLTVEDMDIHNADPNAHNGILQKVSTLLTDVVAKLASNATISISSLNTNSVFYRLLSYALTAAGVQYNFQNSNAWYICLGSLFGGLIILGGTCSGTTSNTTTVSGVFESPQNMVNYPLAFTTHKYLIIGSGEDNASCSGAQEQMIIIPTASLTSFRLVTSARAQNKAITGCWIALGS